MSQLNDVLKLGVLSEIQENLFCRCCLAPLAFEQYSNIFSNLTHNELIADVIQNFVNITISTNDKLPKSVCSCCCQKLIIVNEFKSVIQDANEKLSKFSKKETDSIIRNVPKMDGGEVNDECQFIDEIEIKEEPLDVDLIKLEEIESDIEDIIYINNESRKTTLLASDNESRVNRYGYKVREEEDPPFKCDICEESFFSEKMLEIHNLHHPNKDSIICHICGSTFIGVQNFEVHLKEHQDRCSCNICNEHFTSILPLMTHLLTHREVKYFDCVTCHRKFLSPYKFQRHLTIHKKYYIEEALVGSIAFDRQIRKLECALKKPIRTYPGKVRKKTETIT